MRNKAYIAGQISGLAKFNTQKYLSAEALCIDWGYNIIRPLPLAVVDTKDWDSYSLKCTMEFTQRFNVIIALEDWKRNRATAIEVWTAQRMNIPIISITTMRPIRVSAFMKLKIILNLI